MGAHISRLGLDPEVAIVSKKTGIGRSAHTFINKLETYSFSNDTGTDHVKGSEVERDGAALVISRTISSIIVTTPQLVFACTFQLHH